MKEDKILRQCPEAECRLVKYFIVARKFRDRLSYEKKDNKEIINLKNRYCTIKFENIFEHQEETDAFGYPYVKVNIPQYMKFTEEYDDPEIQSFGKISNSIDDENKHHWIKDDVIEFTHVIKYKNKAVFITYRRPRHNCNPGWFGLNYHGPYMQLTYYEDANFIDWSSDWMLLRDAEAESNGCFIYRDDIKYKFDTCTTRDYSETAFAEMYSEAEKLLGIKLGYRKDLALKSFIDKRNAVKRREEFISHMSRVYRKG